MGVLLLLITLESFEQSVKPNFLTMYFIIFPSNYLTKIIWHKVNNITAFLHGIVITDCEECSNLTKQNFRNEANSMETNNLEKISLYKFMGQSFSLTHTTENIYFLESNNNHYKVYSRQIRFQTKHGYIPQNMLFVQDQTKVEIQFHNASQSS
jgi:hypothetical protein